MSLAAVHFFITGDQWREVLSQKKNCPGVVVTGFFFLRSRAETDCLLKGLAAPGTLRGKTASRTLLLL
jgi:hypothetical protein